MSSKVEKTEEQGKYESITMLDSILSDVDTFKLNIPHASANWKLEMTPEITKTIRKILDELDAVYNHPAATWTSLCKIMDYLCLHKDFIYVYHKFGFTLANKLKEVIRCSSRNEYIKNSHKEKAAAYLVALFPVFANDKEVTTLVNNYTNSQNGNDIPSSMDDV